MLQIKLLLEVEWFILSFNKYLDSNLEVQKYNFHKTNNFFIKSLIKLASKKAESIFHSIVWQLKKWRQEYKQERSTWLKEFQMDGKPLILGQSQSDFLINTLIDQTQFFGTVL